MSVRLLFLSILLMSMATLFAQQNLIPNPDFEDYYSCDYNYFNSLLQEVMPYWTARVATPHYENEDCLELTHPAYNGNGFITALVLGGIVPDTSGGQRREYAQVELIDSIYQGRNYYLEYFVRQPYSDDGTLSNLGVYFNNEVVLDATNPQPINFSPIITEPQLEVDSLVSARNGWKKLSFCYVPDQNYSVATFGIFRSIDSIQYDFESFFLYSYDAFYLIEIPDTLSLVSTPERDTICAGECITFSSNHSRVPGTFLWDLPGSDLLTATDSVVTVCYDQPGIYPVGLSTEHCHGNYSRQWPEAVVVLASPEPNTTTQNYQLLSGESLQLFLCDTTIDWTVNWSPHPGLSCLDCPDPVFSGSSTTELTAAISINGACPDTCRYLIEVSELARARVTVSNSQICLGDCFQFTNSSLNASGDLRFGPPGGPFESVPVATAGISYCPTEAGTYDLLFIVSGGLNTDTLRLTDLITDPPPFPFQVPQDFATTIGERLNLEAAFQADNYFWEVLGGDLSLNCFNCPRVRVDPFLSGSIQLTATNGSCIDSTIYTVEVARQEPQLYLPNAFSPNFDGVNDDFRAYGNFFTTRSLEVYDRYGGLMHSATGPDVRWDGFAAGRPVTPGVYVYVLRYENIYGEALLESGSVTVVP